jgi:hypothetical protein
MPKKTSRTRARPLPDARRELAACRSQFFNPVAGRPYATAGRTNSTIRVNMTKTVPLLTTNSVAGVYTAQALTLASFAEATEYFSLFDQYMIEEAEAWIEPINTGAGNDFATLATCVDLDDANSPSSVAQVAAHQQSLTAVGAAGQYHRWVPHIAMGAYASGAFTSFANMPPQWIDSGSPGVQHYGLKAAADVTVAPILYQVTFRVRVAFRNPGI